MDIICIYEENGDDFTVELNIIKPTEESFRNPDLNKMFYWATDQNNKSVIVSYSLLPATSSLEREGEIFVGYKTFKAYHTIKFKRYLYDDRD